MKSIKSFFAIFLIALLFVAPVFVAPVSAQGIVGVKSYDLGTVANTVWEGYQAETFAGLIKQFGCNKIDSIIVSITVKNETDIDTLNWYPVNWTADGTAVQGTVVTYTVTLNIAAAGTGTQVLYTSNHGVQGASFRGYEGFNWRTRGAVSGNDVDGSNANSVKVTLTFWGS
jgi:hypothetical protein